MGVGVETYQEERVDACDRHSEKRSSHGVVQAKEKVKSASRENKTLSWAHLGGCAKESGSVGKVSHCRECAISNLTSLANFDCTASGSELNCDDNY